MANALVVGVRFEITAIGDIVEVLDILEKKTVSSNGRHIQRRDEVRD